MVGYVITVGTGRQKNWQLGRNNHIWAMRKNFGIRAGDDLFFWQSGEGLIAHAKATTDGTRVLNSDRLPWPDHDDDPYRWKFGIEVVEEPKSPVESQWRVIQDLLGKQSRPSNAASRIDTNERVLPFLELFDPDLGHHPRNIEREVDAQIDELTSERDAREFVQRSIAQRRGQRRFRELLLRAYDGACCVTACNVEPALEAAHILPYRGDHTNLTANGLLLRADIHTLFDLHLLTIDAADLKVRLAPTLRGSEYEMLHGRPMRRPRPGAAPDRSALAQHNKALGRIGS